MAPTSRSPAAPVKPASLQLDEDMSFQRRSWVIERVGWIIMAAIVVAALLGLFSAGPLSSATAQDATGSVRITYDRFERVLGPSTLRVVFPAAEASGSDGTVSLRFSRSYLESIQIEWIQPEPQRSLADPDGVLFVFGHTAADGPEMAVFAIKPQEAGLIRGEIGLAGQPPVRFTQFVYP